LQYPRKARAGFPENVAGLVYRPLRSGKRHDLALPAEGTYGQAAANDFAERSKIGPNAEHLLRPADAEPVTGNNFIEDEEHIVGLW